MNTINVTEELQDGRRECEYGGTRRLVGRVTYNYTAPTHWSSGICSVAVDHDFNGDISVSLHWGSGGINTGFTDIQIADTMARAFSMASTRMRQIEEASK